MTILYLGSNNIQGLSTDTKPTNVADNSVFYETDTYTFWRKVSGSWKELSQVQSLYDYVIYNVGGTYKAKNMRTGIVDFTNGSADVGALTNSVIGVLTTGGGAIGYTRDLFNIGTPIAVPKASAGVVKPFGFYGAVDSNTRDVGTQFKISSAFPTTRYIFESISAAGSGTTSKFTIKNFNFVNNLWARDGNGNNIGGTSTVIDAGLIKFESDTNSGLGAPLYIEDVYTQYLWRGIHLLGYMYWPVINNVHFTDVNTNFVGDFDIQIEYGNASHADMAKAVHMTNVRATHTAGDSSGRGSMNASLNLGGGYHYVQNYYVDGCVYNDCVVGFKRCYSSKVDRIQAIDLANGVRATVPGTFKGVYLFDTTDPGGITATGNYSTFNNEIYSLAGAPTNYTLAFRNSPFKNIIRVLAYWGGNITIDDSGAGSNNLIELIEGQQTGTNAKITSTNSLVKIVDKRAGASNDGISTQSGDGSTTIFNITHGLYTTPSDYNITPISVDAQGAYDVSVSSTQLTITYKIAPPGGTSNNLKWRWITEVY